MSRVSVAPSMPDAIDDLGLSFVDCVKNARQIAIVSTGSTETTQALIDAIDFHCRTPIVMIDAAAWNEAVEGSIPRTDGVRMAVCRPKSLIDADVVMMVAQAIPDVRRKTENVIEQYLFATWRVPPRSDSAFLHPHDPWLEGDLRNEVIADLYAQKPITLAFLDGTTSTGTLLGGFDVVAVDAVAARTRDIDPESIGYLQELSAKGFGTCALSKIDVPLGMMLS